MSETLIISFLSLLGTAIGAFGGYRLIAYRLEQLEKKVDRHNALVERLPVLEEKIAVANKRIGALEAATERLKECF